MAGVGVKKKAFNIIKQTAMLSISPLPTSKDQVYKGGTLADLDVIPRVTSNVIFNGSSGSGKTTLLVRLILDMYPQGTFDRLVLVSPTCKSDDVQKQLHHLIDEEDMVDDIKEAAKKLEELADEQREIIEKESASSAPRVLVMYDDCMGEKAFMRESIFTKSFIASRHYNFTTFICSQSWTAVPRKCRLQAQNIFFFPGLSVSMC